MSLQACWVTCLHMLLYTHSFPFLLAWCLAFCFRFILVLARVIESRIKGFSNRFYRDCRSLLGSGDKSSPLPFLFLSLSLLLCLFSSHLSFLPFSSLYCYALYIYTCVFVYVPEWEKRINVELVDWVTVLLSNNNVRN
jgi:hypothetical protein